MVENRNEHKDPVIRIARCVMQGNPHMSRKALPGGGFLLSVIRGRYINLSTKSDSGFVYPGRQKGKTMNQFLIKGIKKYQATLSVKLHDRGVMCLFEPSCSHYAIKALENHNIFIAVPMIAYRLLSCNPINARLKSKGLTSNN